MPIQRAEAEHAEPEQRAERLPDVC